MFKEGDRVRITASPAELEAFNIFFADATILSGMTGTIKEQSYATHHKSRGDTGKMKNAYALNLGIDVHAWWYHEDFLTKIQTQLELFEV